MILKFKIFVLSICHLSVRIAWSYFFQPVGFALSASNFEHIYQGYKINLRLWEQIIW